MFLTDALEHLALGERLERVLLLLGVLLLEQRLAREHDVAALLVDLDDAHAQFLPAQRVEVADGTHVDLRSRQERAHADVDRQPALDPLDDAADDDLALGVGLLDLVPDLHLLGFFAREDDVAFAIFGALEQHVDDVAGLDGHLAVLVEELADADDAFGLVADVDDDFRRGHLEDRALDDLAFRDVLEAVIVDFEQLVEFVGIDLVVVVSRSSFEAAAIGALGDVPGGRACPCCCGTLPEVDWSSTFAMPCVSPLSIELPAMIAGAGARESVRVRLLRRTALRERFLNSDKHQRVRHLSRNCQGSERTPAYGQAKGWTGVTKATSGKPAARQARRSRNASAAAQARRAGHQRREARTSATRRRSAPPSSRRAKAPARAKPGPREPRAPVRKAAAARSRPADAGRDASRPHPRRWTWTGTASAARTGRDGDGRNHGASTSG